MVASRISIGVCRGLGSAKTVEDGRALIGLPMRLFPAASQSAGRCSQRRTISVKAVRAAKQAQAEAEAAAAARTTPNRPLLRPTADPFGPDRVDMSKVPIELQRARAVFRRALLQGDLPATLENYRTIAAKKAAHILGWTDYMMLLRALGRPILSAPSYMPTLADVEAMETVLADLNSQRGPTDPYPPEDIYRALLDAHGRLGNIERMTQLWEEMQAHGVNSSVESYNALMRHYTRDLQLKRVEATFQSLLAREDLQPNVQTYTQLMIARISHNDIAGALDAMAEWKGRGKKISLTMMTQLLLGYKKTLDIAGMEACVKMMNDAGFQASRAIYNTRLDAYAKAGQQAKALEILKEMRKEADAGRLAVTPNVVTFNIIIDMYSKADELDSCLKLFHEMTAAGIQPDAITYTSLMDAHRRTGHYTGVEKYFHSMKSAGIKPTSASYSVLIETRTSEETVARAVETYQEMLDADVIPRRNVFISLIRTHAKAGDLRGVREYYREMRSKKITPDTTVLTIVMSEIAMRAPPGPSLIDDMRSYYDDVEKFGRYASKISHAMLLAHIRAGAKPIDAFNALHESVFFRAGVRPSGFTLHLLMTYSKHSSNKQLAEGADTSVTSHNADAEVWDQVAALSVSSGKEPQAAAGVEHLTKALLKVGNVDNEDEVLASLSSFDSAAARERLREARVILKVFAEAIRGRNTVYNSVIFRVADHISQLVGREWLTRALKETR
ncbi:hypothetical protein BC832DRAFT_589927 [Gaertneriomyces semiglobifer]|nr:hypothetical protein BC832DRAFT_589927 [Gaertneriomyces semiglobifer]